MKHFIVAIVLLFTFSILSHAQEKAFQFGFKLGPSVGWIKPDSENYLRDGTKTGFNWGFVADIHLMENYSAHTGFNVIYMNGAYSYPHKTNPSEEVSSLVTGTMNRVIHLKYIQLPAVLRMKTNEISGFVIFGEAGLALAINTGAKADDTFIKDGMVLKEVIKTDISKQIRFTRESMILGGGVYYNLGGSSKLTAGLRFDNNIFDILKDQNSVNPEIEQKAISNFIELNFGLLF